MAGEGQPNWSERTEADLKRLSGPGIRIFLNITQAWGLSAEQQCQLLGGIEMATLQTWARDRDGLLDLDQLERVSHVIGIYRSLHTLLPTTADGWVNRPNDNPLFQGHPAIETMTRDDLPGLREVRAHLQSRELGWGDSRQRGRNGRARRPKATRGRANRLGRLPTNPWPAQEHPEPP